MSDADTGCVTILKTFPNPGETAGVAGGNDGGSGGTDVGEFTGLQAVGHIRLCEVVDACRATADLAFCERDEVDAGNSGEQSAGGLPDALPMGEMTRVMVSKGSTGFSAKGRSGAIHPTSSSHSETSRTFAAKAAALTA